MGVYSVNGNQKILENSAVVPNIVSKASTSSSASPLPQFRFFDDLGEQIINITAPKADSVFGETISQALSESLVKNRKLLMLNAMRRTLMTSRRTLSSIAG